MSVSLEELLARLPDERRKRVEAEAARMIEEELNKSSKPAKKKEN